MISPDILALLRRANVPPGPDVEPVERGPNLFLALTNPEAVRRVAKAAGDGRPGIVRRTCAKSTGPYADANGLMITYEFHGYNQLWIAKDVVEAMIRNGELVMAQPGETYQQDLYWRDDPWFQQNRATVLQGREPYMP